MQAYCKKLMQDEKALALVWQCYCKYWWSNQFWFGFDLHGWILAEQVNQSQDLISAFLFMLVHV